MSEEPKFTAGPWAVNPFSAQVDCAKLSRIGGLLPVAQMLWPTDERSEAETEANARLIAAAPCMAGYIRKRAEAGDAEAAELWGRVNANS